MDPPDTYFVFWKWQSDILLPVWQVQWPSVVLKKSENWTYLDQNESNLTLCGLFSPQIHKSLNYNHILIILVSLLCWVIRIILILTPWRSQPWPDTPNRRYPQDIPARPAPPSGHFCTYLICRNAFYYSTNYRGYMRTHKSQHNWK